MAVITIIPSTVLPEPTTVETSRKIFDLPPGTVLVPTPPSNIAEDYTIYLHGVPYVCNAFYDYETKVKVALHTNNDKIAIEYFKATGEVKLILRYTDGYDLNAGQRFRLECNPTEEHIHKKAVVRFTKDKAFEIDFNETIGTAELKEV